MIQVNVKNYCHDCPEFDPILERPTNLYGMRGVLVESVGGGIVCKHDEKCRRIRRYADTNEHVLYLCDQKSCNKDCSYPTCKRTGDISHAKNFIIDPCGSKCFIEKENETYYEFTGN